MSFTSNMSQPETGISAIPVSRLVHKIKDLLEKVDISKFPISGELSNLRPGGNNHLYFNLKDETASISCVMWAGVHRTLSFVPADGMSVIVHGTINVYEKRGTVSLVVQSMSQTGVGMLYAQLEALKRKLDAEGLFNPAHKKPKPPEIRQIGLVTGENTAALQDVMKTIRTRWPMLRVTLFPTLVQGERAPADIVEALKRADASGQDAILLVRGGGSFEDLFCFNDERIVRQLYNMKTYTVTGIGHEIDTSLADLASDHKALTPTAAAQWVTEDQRDVMHQIQVAKNRMTVAMKRILDMNRARLMMAESSPFISDPMSYARSRRQQLDYLNARLSHSLSQCDQKMHTQLQQFNNEMILLIKNRLAASSQKSAVLAARLASFSVGSRIAQDREQILFLKDEMQSALIRLMAQNSRELESLRSLLEALSPMSILDKGYAIVEKDGHILRDVSETQAGDHISVLMSSGSLLATVSQTALNPKKPDSEIQASGKTEDE